MKEITTIRKMYFEDGENISEIQEKTGFDRMLTPEQTRSYLPQDGYDQNLSSLVVTDQVLKGYFIQR